MMRISVFIGFVIIFSILQIAIIFIDKNLYVIVIVCIIAKPIHKNHFIR